MRASVREELEELVKEEWMSREEAVSYQEEMVRMRVRHFLTSSLVLDLDPGSRDTHSSPLVTTDATCKAYGVELVVNSKVDLLKEKIPPPVPAQSLPPGPSPSSSTRS